MVAARATGKEQRPLPCGSHSRRRAKQIDRAVFRLHSVHAECVQQTGITLISLSQNELRPTQPGFVLAAGSRLTPLVPALDSPKLSTPTVLVSARSLIQPRAGLIAMGSSSPQPSTSACIYLNCRHLGRFHLPSRWSSQKSRTHFVWLVSVPPSAWSPLLPLSARSVPSLTIQGNLRACRVGVMAPRVVARVGPARRGGDDDEGP